MHMREYSNLGFFDQITGALDTFAKGAQQVLQPVQTGVQTFRQYQDIFRGGTSPFNIPALPQIKPPAPSLPATSTIAPPPPSIKPTSLSRSEISNIQSRLKEIGFDPGPIDGLYGPRTEGAIKAFQSAQGLPVTGVANLDLLNRLKPIATQRPSNPVVTGTPQNPVGQGSGALPYRPTPVQQVPVPVPVAVNGGEMPPWLIPAGIGAIALVAVMGGRRR